MKHINLEWCVFPACIYEYLLSFKEKDMYYNPLLGPGIYAFIHSNGKRYQVYYIGISKSIGDRLYSHYLEYAGEKKSCYWIPCKSELFNGDIYKLFNRNPEGGVDFKQEGTGLTKEERMKVGKEIIHSTYFAFAKINPEESEWIPKIEAALHHSILKKHELKKYGWIGERNSIISKDDMIIKSEYSNSIIRKMINNSIPEEIRVEDGEII